VSYRVELAPPARRAIERLRPIVGIAVRGLIASLAHDPHPPHTRKVVGTVLYRIRLRVDGVPWRVVYTISDTDQLVVVTRVVRRDEATYRGL